MHEISVTLQRHSTACDWGFSLIGGSDLEAPFIVTRVVPRSPADGSLQRGDIITKVGSYDARDMRHQDAQDLFRNTGNNVHVVVQRDGNTSQRGHSTGSSRPSSRVYSPLSVSPHLSPRSGIYSAPSSYSPGGSALTPQQSSPMKALDNNHFEAMYLSPGGRKSNPESDDLHLSKQPYRTTPLVLPGAKAKHEPPPTECYLRHHPNPAVRAAPHLDTLLMKQKIASKYIGDLSPGSPNKQIVHNQFNSPIDLYSDSNIADTIQKQTGLSPPIRKQVKFNPAESETYKVIQEQELGDEVQEVGVPQSRVYSPSFKPIPSKQVTTAASKPIYSVQVAEDEEPRQSNTFKRLMWSVLAENSY